MSTMKIHSLLVLVLVSLLVACADSGDDAGNESYDSATIEVDDAKADGVEEVELRAAEMTIWVRPAVSPVEVDGNQLWKIQARISYNVADLSASIAGAPARSIESVSSRKFEILLSHEQMAQAINGERLLIDVVTGSGKERTVMMTFRSRLAELGGHADLYVDRTISAVQLGDQTVFRTDVVTATPVSRLDVVTEVDAGNPKVSVRDEANNYRLDWNAMDLLVAAHAGEGRVIVSARQGRAKLKRAVALQIRLADLGLTNDEPAIVWPAHACDSRVAACLDNLGGVDTQACGDAWQVRACMNGEPVEPVDNVDFRANFARDLGDAITSHYEVAGDDITGAGGRELSDALAAIEEAKIAEITDPANDPQNNDLSTHIVLTHPDPIFEGSGGFWFGVYERDGDGSLIAIYSAD